MEYILVAFVVLLIFGNLSRKSAGHPLNTVSIAAQPPVLVNRTVPTGGDTFTSGCSLVAGVPEPQPMPVTSAPDMPIVKTLPLHVTFPVDPPPIAIQKPIVAPKPPLRITPPTRQVQMPSTMSAFCGFGSFIGGTGCGGGGSNEIAGGEKLSVY